MKLLYCHVEFLDANGNKKRFRGLEQINLNLSTTHVFSYDSREGILCKHLRDKPLPGHFWASGDKETNLYNINVVAGKNGSGKSTVINYVIDLLYYIYLDFGRQQSNILESARFDVEQNYNLLAFEEDCSLYVVELLPDGNTRQKLEECQVCECNRKKRDDETAHIIRGKKDVHKITKKFKKLFKSMKVIYMMNNPTQRDYERNLYRQEGGLRNYFVYDCSLGAYLGWQMTKFFPYEVYKQVRYLFDGNQAEIRKEIERRIRKVTEETDETCSQKPDELIMPRALKLRPRITMLTDRLILQLTPSFAANEEEHNLTDKDLFNALKLMSINEILGELCCRSFVTNASGILGEDEKDLVNTASKLLYKSSTKIESIFEEQKHCIHAVANAAFHKPIERNSATCCAVLHDGRIVSGSIDGLLCIWDPHTGKHLWTQEGHTRPVTCLTLLPGGRIVSGSNDKALRIWDPDTGECLQVLEQHTDSVTCVAVLPNGHIASGSNDKTLRIWNPDTGECLRILKQVALVTCLAALPDGRIVSGSNDGTIRIWNADTGDCLCTIEGDYAFWINCLAVLHDGRIVSGSNDGTLCIWDPNTGKFSRMLEQAKRLSCLAVLFDGHIVSGSFGGTLCIWDPNTGACLRALKGHANDVICLIALRDGHIISGSTDGTIRIWDKTTSECVSIFSIDAKYQFVEMLRRNCIAYLDFLAAKENDDSFARFARVENEACCFELPLETDEKDASQDERLQRFMTEFIQRYRYTCEPVYTIDFDWGLSSGEQNMLRLFANLFHIFDRDYSSGNYGECRIYNDEWANKSQRNPHVCTSVMLFLDEADLTLHPEWQRRLIHVLTAALPLIYPKSCAKDMQLILSTHSPLLLGDIPRENICYLGGGRSVGVEAVSKETFGQNIHTLLKDSFFLDNGTVGEFASSKINGVATRLEEILQGETKVAKGDSLNTETYRKPSTEELADIRKTIDLVANGILRVWLEERWQKVSAVLNEHMRSKEADKLADEGEKLTQEERRYILCKWLEAEKL
jgi:WD40 repeat protein